MTLEDVIKKARIGRIIGKCIIIGASALYTIPQIAETLNANIPAIKYIIQHRPDPILTLGAIYSGVVIYGVSKLSEKVNREELEQIRKKNKLDYGGKIK